VPAYLSGGHGTQARAFARPTTYCALTDRLNTSNDGASIDDANSDGASDDGASTGDASSDDASSDDANDDGAIAAK
jgi:hypothetical protein